MGLPGINNQDEIDFPRPVKESVTVLPFHIGGEVVLDTTDVDETLVKVADLRRFENMVGIATGADGGGGNAAFLTDSVGDFLDKGVEVGDTVFNTTDSSQAVITAVTATRIDGTLAGGTDDDWDSSDVYRIDKTLSHQGSRAAEIRRLSITVDLATYIRIDGDASAASHSRRLEDLGEWTVENLRCVSRISFVNVGGTDTPRAKFYVSGI